MVHRIIRISLLVSTFFFLNSARAGAIFPDSSISGKASPKGTLDWPREQPLGLRVVNGHSTATLPKRKLEFYIQHRFGTISQGRNSLYGLDESNIRFGFDYGLLNKVTVGVGRSNIGKVYNGFVKWNLIPQSNDNWFSATWFSDMAISAEHKPVGMEPYYFSHRIKYTHQIIVSTTLKPGWMLQIAPTIVHRNLVDSAAEPNDMALLVGTVRFRLNKSICISGEYNYIFHHDMRKQLTPCVGMGVEIYTAGHVFQLVLTNANAMNESQYMTVSNGDIKKREFRLGFNIVRRF